MIAVKLSPIRYHLDTLIPCTLLEAHVKPWAPAGANYLVAPFDCTLVYSSVTLIELKKPLV